MFEFQFDSLADFFAMGGYAFYVWSAYACFFVIMGWNLIQPRIDRRKLLHLLKARQQREAAQQRTQDHQQAPTEA